MSNKHKIDFQSLSIAEVLPLFGKHSTFVEYKHKVKMKYNPFTVDMLLFNRQLRCFVAVNIRKMLQIQDYRQEMEFILNMLYTEERLDHEKQSIGISMIYYEEHFTVLYTYKVPEIPEGVLFYNSTSYLPEDLMPHLPDFITLKSLYERLCANNK
jgi:hypothetical protein